MSCCTKLAIARILSIGVAAEDVSSDTFCLISGDGSRRPVVNIEYQAPMVCQFENPLLPAPPGGRKFTIIRPARPFVGGMSSSGRIPPKSRTTHSHEFPPG